MAAAELVNKIKQRWKKRFFCCKYANDLLAIMFPVDTSSFFAVPFPALCDLFNFLFQLIS